MMPLKRDRVDVGSESAINELISQILQCPDCDEAIRRDLRCPRCGCSFEPDSDGIITALSHAMQRPAMTKQTLESAIRETSANERDGNVVLYEQLFHDEQAPYYDSRFADPLPVRTYYRRLVRTQIYAYLADVPFVVDLCCGTGKSSAPLVERGLTVVGMDVSREMLRVYRRKCAGASRLMLIQADASHPPLRRNSCSAITMIGGLHHIPDRVGSLKVCCEALSVGGVLIVHEPLKTGRRSKLADFVENLYVVTDPVRMSSAIGRRIGLVRPRSDPTGRPATLDFTPFERPFTSPDELVDAVPSTMRTIAIRGQGVLSFREFAPFLQRAIGKPLAALIVRIDEWLSRKKSTMWSGDAVFAVFRKTPDAGDRS